MNTLLCRPVRTGKPVANLDGMGGTMLGPGWKFNGGVIKRPADSVRIATASRTDWT